ncbi:MAG: hypothetical protein FJ145_03805 [Deltaproteobacteria bacterium]|nr:hypothetical protein [Deltaproteobacteria bacterium]
MKIEFDSSDREKMLDLLEKAKAGELTQEQAQTLEHYRHVGRLLELMKSGSAPTGVMSDVQRAACAAANTGISISATAMTETLKVRWRQGIFMTVSLRVWRVSGLRTACAAQAYCFVFPRLM